jgi:hypothetical protein
MRYLRKYESSIDGDYLSSEDIEKIKMIFTDVSDDLDLTESYDKFGSLRSNEWRISNVEDRRSITIFCRIDLRLNKKITKDFIREKWSQFIGNLKIYGYAMGVKLNGKYTSTEEFDRNLIDDGNIISFGGYITNK